MKKKIIAIILAISIILSAFIVPVYANTDISKPAEQKLYSVLDNIVNVLVGGIAALIKTPDWGKKADYKTPDSFLEGMSKEEFKDTTDDNAAWSLGYDDDSLVENNGVEEVGECYVGGSLSVTKKLATKQLDDQRVRVIAVSDGRGITIFASLDAYGMANTDVRAIRKQFLDQYKGEKEITAINISALHQHSCSDTFGMNGDIVGALFLSSIRSILGLELPSGQNEKFMEDLYKKTINCMNNAVANMTEGDLYYGKVDVSDFIRDKREPENFDPNLNRFRFVPADGSEETWFVEGAIHCVGNGAAGKELTGDYPLYMQRYIKENYNANFIYVEGAELAISSTDKTATEEYIGDVDSLIKDDWDPDTAGMRAYGENLASKLGSIKEEDEIKLDPILNIAYKEVWIPVTNNILILAAKGGLLKNNIFKAGFNKFEIVSEVGYAEFGKDLAVAIIPGELEPSIAFGGVDEIENNWTGDKWEISAFSDIVGERQLIVFGITNDQVGYLLPTPFWHSFFTENEEIVSSGKMAGTIVANEFIDLYKSVA